MSFFNAIGSTVKTGWNAAKKGIQKIGSTIKAGGKWAADTSRKGAIAIGKTIKGTPNALLDANRWLWTGVSDAAAGAGKSVHSLTSGAVGGATSGLGSSITQSPLLIVGLGVIAFAAVKAL